MLTLFLKKPFTARKMCNLVTLYTPRSGIGPQERVGSAKNMLMAQLWSEISFVTGHQCAEKPWCVTVFTAQRWRVDLVFSATRTVQTTLAGV
jgi:hypothetical protein